MKTETLHIITGLPRTGSSVIANILKQNPEIHSEVNSSLPSLIGGLHANWSAITNGDSLDKKSSVLRGIIEGFYSNISQPVVFDRSINWVPLIPQLEAILQREVKILVCVRNPAEILTSFEKSRKENPLAVSEADQQLKSTGSSIASRAFHYAGPDGALGTSHRNIKDAVTMGYLDRMLFVDYGRYCSSPKSQTKRIYDFFKLPEFTHDFTNITGDNMGTRNELIKTTVNCVEYLGLDLYEQYNREIFWTAWV